MLKKSLLVLLAAGLSGLMLFVAGCSELDNKAITSVEDQVRTIMGTELTDTLLGEPESGKQIGVQTPLAAGYPGYCYAHRVPFMTQVLPGTWSGTNNCGQAVCVMLGGYFNRGQVAPWVIDAENRWLGCRTGNGCTTSATTLKNLLWGFH